MSVERSQDPRVFDAQAQLRELRDIKVVVFHPDNRDGLLLIQQLQRIGCQVQAFWPPLRTLPERTEVVFLAIRPDALNVDFDWLRGAEAPTVIAVVDFENPTIINAVIAAQARAVLPLPIRNFGLLSTLVVAREVRSVIRAQQKHIERANARLQAARKVADAKLILSRLHGVDDAEAYRMIRSQAMSKRTTVEEIAAAIISADGVLSFQGERRQAS